MFPMKEGGAIKAQVLAYFAVELITLLYEEKGGRRKLDTLSRLIITVRQWGRHYFGRT